ncbi:MAG: family 43 glycosylhydrolase, partial [Candidatus Cyclobacteriaceae bacterium M3_2C_046]
MKNLYVILITFIFYACHSSGNKEAQNETLDSNTFTNPILAGDYPDPSLFRDGDTYYMTHSSFEYYPGLLIWKSQDLVNWTPVSHALHEYVGSVWAPDFIKHDEKYYIYFPAAGSNWVVTADHPEGPWNPPVDLKVGHIDPGHVVGEDGTRYLHLSGGHAVQLTDDGLATAGEVKKVYDGWQFPEEWSVECFCLEAPKLTKLNDFYYLTVAEGGTAGPATSHMVVSARSKNALGPWENSPYNPVVHTQSKDDRWWSTGHGTLVDDTQGNWWIMFHGYEKGYHTLGRQTLMQP